MNGFDIEEQAQAAEQEDAGIEVHIHGVDEEPLYYEANGEISPVVIVVAGQHSSQFRRAEQLIRKRPIKAGRKFSQETIHNDNIEKIVACTLAWRGVFNNGEPFELTPHNARTLYKRAPWVLEQVMEAVMDHQRFFEKPSTQQ